MIKGIIFDLDGTLLNTLKDIKASLNHALKTFGYKKITLAQTKSFIGNGGKELVERALKSQGVEFKEEVLDEFRSYYVNHSIDFTTPYEGIYELLNELKKKNIKLAVASNKFYKTAYKILDTLFKDTFEFAIGSGTNLKLKPSPDIIFASIEKMNIKVDECLYVGDSEVDILAAKNANMKVISVLWGYRSKKILSKLNPDYMIKTPNEILKIIDKENEND